MRIQVANLDKNYMLAVEYWHEHDEAEQLAMRVPARLVGSGNFEETSVDEFLRGHDAFVAPRRRRTKICFLHAEQHVSSCPSFGMLGVPCSHRSEGRTFCL